MKKIPELSILPDEIAEKYRYGNDDPLLEYVSIVAKKYKPPSPDDLENGFWVSRAIGAFVERYLENEIDKSALQKYLDAKEMLETIDAMGYEVDKFWYLLLFINDYSNGFCSKGIKINESPKEQITNLVDGIMQNIKSLGPNSWNSTFIKPAKLVLNLKGEKNMKGKNITVDNPNALIWLAVMLNGELEKIEDGSKMATGNFDLKITNGHLENDPLSKSYRIWFFAKMFLSFFVLQPPKKTIGLKNKEGLKISINKNLLITRLLFCIGLLSEKDNQDTDDTLKGFLKQYKNADIFRINGLYM